MHDLILFVGFAGAWLLLAGPLRQAVIELTEEGLERERLGALMRSAPPPDPVSAWWWLLPPVRLFLNRRAHDRWEATMLAALPDEDYAAMTSYMNKARAWLLVGSGGFLIAAKETYELVEGLEWPTWLFWLLVVGLLFVCVAGAALQSAREGRQSEKRAARKAPTRSRISQG